MYAFSPSNTIYLFIYTIILIILLIIIIMNKLPAGYFSPIMGKEYLTNPSHIYKNARRKKTSGTTFRSSDLQVMSLTL